VCPVKVHPGRKEQVSTGTKVALTPLEQPGLNGLKMRLTGILASLVVIPLAVGLAPIRNEGVSAQSVVPDSYIVRLKKEVTADQIKQHEDMFEKAAQSINRLNSIFHGYVIKASPEGLETIRNCELVRYKSTWSHRHPSRTPSHSCCPQGAHHVCVPSSHD